MYKRKGFHRSCRLSRITNVYCFLGKKVECMKVAMRLLTKVDVGPPRPPYKPLSEESVAKMNNELVKMGYKTYH